MVTWSSSSHYATIPPAVSIGATNDTCSDGDVPGFAIWDYDYGPPPSIGVTATGTTHASYYPLQDNGKGTVMGIGATMARYTAVNSVVSHPAPNIPTSVTIDANVTASGTLGAYLDFTGQPITTGGGYVSSGGTNLWIKGIPLAVNSAGQVLGLEDSVTNSSADARSTRRHSSIRTCRSPGGSRRRCR